MTFESLQGNEALSRVDGDIRVFSNGGMTPEVPLEFQCETGLLLVCDRNVGIPLQTKQVIDPHLKMRWATQHFLELGQGTGPFTTDATGVSDLLSCCEGILGVPFELF